MSIQIKAVEQYFVVRHAVFMWYRVVLAFASVEIVLKCEHSNKSCRAILCCEAHCFYVVQGTASFCVSWNHSTVCLFIKATG